MTNPLNIKKNIKEWANEQWDSKVKNPLANKTEELEQQAGKYWDDANRKFQANNPANYYWKQTAFYRGLFWIAVLVLIVLWLISG